MKAVVIHKAHDLRIEERDPATPGRGQVAIAVKRGGICGSDLHYYRHGGFGTVRLREPMVLGHEVAGEIASVGERVDGLKAGDKVAINPSRPCGQCLYCQKGRQNHCLDMRFYGSAMRFPHVQGAFQELLVADAAQCHKLADGVSLAEGAFAEPFAVALHAIVRSGALANKRVLVTGCGPIGALVVHAASIHGAREIVATDVSDFTLAMAKKVGADRTINVATSPETHARSFDIAIEASGNEQALRTSIDWLRPRGTLVQLGLGGDIAIPQNQIVAKEIEIKGSFRFHEEFALAVDLINRRRCDLTPLLSETVVLADAAKGFDLATDRSRAMKVQIAFS